VTDTPALVEIRILGLPVGIYRETSEHTDDLIREFTLVRESEAGGEGGHVPARLLALVEELTDRFSGFTNQQQTALQQAVERGDPSIDLVYRVPPAVKQGCLDLERMLDEADEFCRAGEALLTLATPPRCVAFRRWYLREFVRQVDGQQPMPWEAFAGTV
jgi:hypothetical protein